MIVVRVGYQDSANPSSSALRANLRMPSAVANGPRLGKKIPKSNPASRIRRIRPPVLTSSEMEVRGQVLPGSAGARALETIRRLI